MTVPALTPQITARVTHSCGFLPLTGPASWSVT